MAKTSCTELTLHKFFNFQKMIKSPCILINPWFELKSASLLAGIMLSSTSCSSLFLGMSQIFTMNDHFVNITYINTKKY